MGDSSSHKNVAFPVRLFQLNNNEAMIYILKKKEDEHEPLQLDNPQQIDAFYLQSSGKVAKEDGMVPVNAFRNKLRLCNCVDIAHDGNVPFKKFPLL